MQRNVISKRTRMNVIGSGLIQLNRFKKCSKTFVLKNDYNFIDFNQFFDYGFEMIVCKLKTMTQQTSIKFNLHPGARAVIWEEYDSARFFFF
ncbi:Uncharacterized protein FWK35_00038911 [Aphis craccivora]|uniref:Uncharacterized protein n=1 Tax=Aphis craccivora TaxID=307492 RepID=A0A6G0VPA3_APHCR|nr:Uncharacterized protein FWK35_00038911 [Aphis craccivora]